jgi:hypothetical protein
MNRRRIVSPRYATAALLAAACMLPLACGGGGGDRLPPESLDAAFQPANPTPGAMTISMGDALTSGAGFQIPILVTGVDDFFGAAFRVNFNPASAEFAGFSDADSFIDTGGGVVVLINAVAGAPGEVLVNATRQQGAGGAYVPGVTPAAPDNLLISLNFIATTETAANTFTFSSQEVRACDDGTQTCPIVDPVTLTWSGGVMSAN